ncbi:MAG: M23 family metallopeptidase [Polyangiaceae bacterium]
MSLGDSARPMLVGAAVLAAVLLLALVTTRAAVEEAVIACEPGDWCPLGSRCTRGLVAGTSSGRCFRVGLDAELVFDLPLASPQGVACVHGPSFGRGTHAFLNSLFALDLSSRADGAPAVIRAAARGTVEGVHRGCADPGGAFGHSDRCGQGFGNWVRVLHADGTASFYAHLARVDVARGDEVERGDVIGLEGITGLTGHRHLHFAVQRRTIHPLDDEPAWQSVAFRLRFRGEAGGEPIVSAVGDLRCRLDDLGSRGWFPPQ